MVGVNGDGDPAGAAGAVPEWAHRCDLAERAVLGRHVRPVWAIPNTRLGVAGWPATIGQRLHLHWNYWWQAHLLDCLLDAQQRGPDPTRMTMIDRLVRGIHLRNFGTWTNRYYDDVAWLGLALLRAQAAGVAATPAIHRICARLREGWTDHGGGGIWWRRRDDFKNVPANGPAAILLARWAGTGGERADLHRARSMVEWIECQLLDQETGMVWDGLHVNPDGSIRDVVRIRYTYCQGVYLGACLELTAGDPGGVWLARAERTISGVATHLAEHGVLPGQGAGDGGLFAGILARYLALAVVRLTELGSPAGAMAAALVLSSARAAWENRAQAKSGPLFGPEWVQPAVAPRSSHDPRLERDLSVQLAGWMLLEAAAFVQRHGAGTMPP